MNMVASSDLINMKLIMINYIATIMDSPLLPIVGAIGLGCCVVMAIIDKGNTNGK